MSIPEFRILLLLFSLMFSGHLMAQEKEGFVNIEDGTLHYKIYGKKGRPILFINGGPGISSKGYQEVAKRLKKLDRTLILFDQRGTGKSDIGVPNHRNVTIDKMVDDIDSLRRQLGYTSWDIIGQSFGATLAMFYAKKYPESVKSMVFVAPGGIEYRFLTRMMTNMEARANACHKSSLSRGQHYVFKPINIERANKWFKAAERSAAGNFVSSALQGAKYDLRNDFGSFKKPVLIIQGFQDIVSNYDAYQIQIAFPEAQLQFINRCGHMIWFDQPGICFDLIESFYEEQQAVK